MAAKSAHKLSNGNFILSWDVSAIFAKRRTIHSSSDTDSDEAKWNLHEMKFNLVDHTSPYVLQLKNEILTLKTADPVKPRMVTAVYDEHPVEMNYRDEVWGPVSWYYSSKLKKKVFSVFLDFKSATESEMTTLSHLGRLLDDQKMTDVQFAVKGQHMGGHVAVLVARSPVLAAMFENQFQENVTRIVQIPDIDPIVFKQLLRYLYTGSVPELHFDGLAEHLFVAADKYQVESLKLLCEKALAKRLKLENVIKILVFAHLHSAPMLYEKASNYIVANAKTVWKQSEWRQMNKSYPDVFYEVSQRVINYNYL